jgi:hypothetical protein
MTDPLIEPFVERRREPRLRSLLTGTIVFDNNKSTLDCTVRSISAHGARVELAEAFRMPERFNLAVPHHDRVHQAEVIWRKGERAGLALSDVNGATFDHRRMTQREEQRVRQKAMHAAW